MDRFLASSCLLVLALTVEAGALSYKLTNLGLIPEDGRSGFVDSFTVGGRITLDAGRYKHLFSQGKFTSLRLYWPDTGRFAFTNDTGQFLDTDKVLYASYRASIDSEEVRLYPQLEFSNQIYANGMNERYIFGAEARTQEDDYAGAYYYEMSTGIYNYIEPFADRQRSSVMAMNNSGYMVVNHGLVNRDGPYDLKTWLYKDGVKQTMVGTTDFSFINGKGQLLGQDIWDYQTTLFFDGVKSEHFSNFRDGKFWRPAGLADDGTMLMNDDEPSHIVQTALRKDGIWYSWHEACASLSPTMRIANAFMREDGAVAAIGVENGKGYLMRFDPVPEPASILALGAGLALLVRRRNSIQSIW